MVAIQLHIPQSLAFTIVLDKPNKKYIWSVDVHAIFMTSVFRKFIYV